MDRWTGSRSAAAVGGVRVRAEQQWHVVVPLIGPGGETDRDLRIEGLLLPTGEVVTGAEVDPVVARFQAIRTELGNSTVVVGDAGGDRLTGEGRQADGHA